MENYKVQMKLAKENVPSFLQNYSEKEVWDGVVQAVENGKAEISLIEIDSAFESFSFPKEIANVQEDWEADFGGNLFLQTDFFLEEDEAVNNYFIRQKFLGLLKISNLLIYSYFYKGNLYQSYGYIDDSFALTEEELQEIEQVEKTQFKKNRK